MLHQKKSSFRKKVGWIASAMVFFFLLSGCDEFNGLRTPLYDNEPIELDEEAARIYEETREIIGDEREFYFRYTLSDDLNLPTLDFSEEDPVLLEEGTYVVGEDLPGGRVNLLGNESNFTAEAQHVRVGNMIIRDEEENVYFENHFHAAYGPLLAQVDLHEGHVIEIIGSQPEITVFYNEVLPENPYVLMDPPEAILNRAVFEEAEEDESEESPTISEQPVIQIGAGIWEVGVHLDPGKYIFSDFIGQRQSELYILRQNEEMDVVELSDRMLVGENSYTHEELDVELEEGWIDQQEYERLLSMLEEEDRDTPPVIELQAGDKLYPNMTTYLELESIE